MPTFLSHQSPKHPNFLLFPHPRSPPHNTISPVSEAAVSRQAATGRDPPQAGTGDLRHQEAEGQQGAEPGGVSRGEEPMQAQAPGLCHPLGLQEPETGERGVRGFCGSCLSSETWVGTTREGNPCCPLLLYKRGEFLMSTPNPTFCYRRWDNGQQREPSNRSGKGWRQSRQESCSRPFWGSGLIPGDPACVSHVPRSCSRDTWTACGRKRSWKRRSWRG